MKNLFKSIFSKNDDVENTLPSIEVVNGIPSYSSPYIRHRNQLGAMLLQKCAANTPDVFTLDDLWKNHPDFPIAICFNVHSLCNERCVMCPYKSTDAQKPTRIMDFDKFKTIWEEFVEAGGKIVTFNNFSDIFAHPVGMDYVHHALKFQDKVSTYFVTNGLALKPEYVDEILATGWDGIMYISCHGFSDETFHKVTGVNAFKRVLENATYLAKRHPKPRNIIIQYATDYSGQEEIDAALAYWGGLGCTVNTFSTHTFGGNSDHREEQPKEGRLAGCKGWGYDAGQLFFQAVIQQNGNLTLCCHDLQGKIIIGNTFTDGLISSWKSKRMKNLVGLIYRGGTNVKIMEICRKCNLAQIV